VTAVAAAVVVVVVLIVCAYVVCEYACLCVSVHVCVCRCVSVSVLCGLRSRSTADLDPQFFLRTRSVRGSDDGKQPRTRTVRGSKLHLAHIKLNLRSSGRMYPAEKQTMQLQARAACASAVHVISAVGVRKSSVI